LLYTIIRKMNEADIPAVSLVHEKVFTRQTQSLGWITSNFNAAPRIMYYVAVIDEQIIGYIEWLQKSGFRKEAILELEQIAVLTSHQKKGVGRQLIDESLKMIKEELVQKGQKIKHVIVTTRADNYAKRLYKEALDARVECTIRDLYSADEVIMIARNIDKKHPSLKTD
jgi:ribosomal protein S18 acetylase RimI-like enzyme